MIKNLATVLVLASATLVFSGHNQHNTNIKNENIVQPAHHAVEKIEKDIGFIDIVGEIDDNTATVVHRGFIEFKKNNIKQVMIHLHSLGGRFTPGSEIVTDMQQAEKEGVNVVTFVDHGNYCASMCTGIFAAGSDRMAAEDTLWVFHAPYFKLTEEQMKDPRVQKELKDIVQQTTQYMLDLYSSADPEWTEKTLKEHITTPDDDLILSGKEIMQQSQSWILMKIEDKSFVEKFLTRIWK